MPNPDPAITLQQQIARRIATTILTHIDWIEHHNQPDASHIDPIRDAVTELWNTLGTTGPASEPRSDYHEQLGLAEADRYMNMAIDTLMDRGIA